jgi:glycosyl transferase family 2
MLEAVVLAAWTIPIVLVGMALVGYVRGRRLRVAYAREMIIQITTVGNQETVNAIIDAIRGYDLDFPFQIWVVSEPSSPTGYLGVDRMIVVPADFECRASYKCRALEYVRRLRATEGLVDRDLKILYLDDDSLPTKGYIEKAFHADHDICQGIVAPRNHYGRFLSCMDDLRTLNCLVFCSVFQSVGHPIQVHGEGLCVRASAEQVVTWDHPVVASEDLVFGQTAAHKGLDWGFFYDFICITSPWNFRDYVKQRRRWTWGNVHAIARVLPPAAKVRLTAKYFLGFGSFSIATAGVLLDRAGTLDISPGIRPLLAISVVAFLGSFALCGWLNGHGRARDSAASVLLAFFTCGFNFFVLLIGLARGNPHRFEVIEKVAAATSDDGPTQRRLAWVPAVNFASVGAASFALGLFFVLVVTAYGERLTG